MRAFSQLFIALDSSTSTLDKIALLQGYFSLLREQKRNDDAAWACYLLAGGRPRRAVSTKVLRAAVIELTRIEPWLFEECYQAVGDLAETIAHLLPEPDSQVDWSLSSWMLEKILPMRGLAEDLVQVHLAQYWQSLTISERLVLNKLLTGGFRLGVSRNLVLRALAQAYSITPALLAQRFVGYTDSKTNPTADRFEQLFVPAQADQNEPLTNGQALPFFLAQSVKGDASFLAQQLGSLQDWYAEWKWDGIRAQLVLNRSNVSLWSRGEELISESFPEVIAMGKDLQEQAVIDGELLVWLPGQNLPQPFADLAQRTTRKKLSAKFLEQYPVVFMAYDLLAFNGLDYRQRPLSERRSALEQFVTAASARLNHPFKLSPLVVSESWEALDRLRQGARANRVEGFMLKHQKSAYGIGRTKSTAVGEWLKWKLDPMSVDAVLVYAQAGHGRRASLYTDYTFAVWGDSAELLPFAKAYSGLTDQEIRQVDAIIKKTTVEKFGPVRSVTPSLVFEVGFEGIQASPRHKAGIAVRFPRILRWRLDKTIDQADSISALRALMV